MGGSGDTAISLEQVKADLVKKLTDNARDLLKKDFNIADNTTNLETLLNRIATSKFKQTYNYDYNDDATKLNPPGNLGDARSSSKICSIIPPVGTQATDYLKTGVFRRVFPLYYGVPIKLNLPDWMEKTAINDLSNIANIIISRDTGKEWRYNQYRRTYDARKEDQDNYMCNSIMVYCYGTLVEDGTKAELAIIYYCGVYYKVKSETKATRDTLQGSAYLGASKLADGSVPTTDELLKASLDTYSKNQFKSQFGYEYASVPPDSYRAKGIDSAFVTQNSQLNYIPDTKTEDLENYIEHQVYSGLNIPIQSVKTAAMKDTYDQYKSILNNASTDSWNQTRLDKTYIPTDPTLNPIRQTGIIMSWYDHKTTDGQVSISVTYIYIMTMFYECQNADQELAAELFKILCNNLRRHIQGDSSGDISDPAKLKEFMKEYSIQEWKKAFGFDYQGRQSKPPKMKQGGRVEPYEELLQVKSYPATKQEVEAWMDAEVFRRTDRKFPDFAMGPVYDDIVNSMMRYGSNEVPKDNNWWYTADFTREYFDPTPQKRDIQQYAFYLYALGDMTINKPGTSGQEGVKIKRLFVYYLGLTEPHSYSPVSTMETGDLASGSHSRYSTAYPWFYKMCSYHECIHILLTGVPYSLDLVNLTQIKHEDMNDSSWRRTRRNV
ncbi:hypothetical protein P691DRAFT_788671 [Macrolepiota fuliginosa MF-IS2]|uniref:Uncharacterized protein n=1 Tax=Macrolepiota fuliginosa MF-IS2 TaxID=1400762 RepID=A0A9P5XK91_9AGAR|nr:hypothetical protein P691DRAFT_788671 [Macrolepiota fuliginosa MF-IS2]